MRKQFPELYTRDSKGEILSWKIEVKDTLDGTKVSTFYGTYYGKQAESSYIVFKGKNIGKSNETTIFEQAIFEANGKINLHKKKGYKSLIDLKIVLPVDENYDTALYHALDLTLSKYRTDKNDNLKPMLCQQYYRNKKNWEAPDGEIWDNRKYYYLMNPYVPKEKGAIIMVFPCILQPKINGTRSINEVKIMLGKHFCRMTSKEGGKISVPHISNALLKLAPIILERFNKEFLALDGELYIHGMPLQDIDSCIKKPNLNTHGLTLQVFDLAIPDVSCLKRIQALDIINKLIPNNILIESPIRIVPSTIVNSDMEVQNDTDVFINMGYEGSIQRDPKGLYEFGKRPKCITKLKRPTVKSFLIVDVIPQDKDPNKGLFVCKTEDGLEFDATPKGTDEFKVMVLAAKDLFVNRILLCYFYEYTKEGKPFHIIYNKVES